MNTITLRGCAYHTIPKPDCLHCRATIAYDADKKPWTDFCPHCESRDLRTNEVGGYIWCSHCGKQNRHG